MRSIAAAAAVLLTSAQAGAICRVVTEIGSAPPAVSPEQSVLLVLREDVALGGDCPGPGGSPDAGLADAGAVDAAAPDAPGPDAEPADAGSPCTPARFADVTTLVVQPSFRAGDDGARFAFLMVTPHRPAVSLYARSIFGDLAWRTRPRPHVTTKTVEDPALGYQCDDPKFASGAGCGGWEAGDYSAPAPAPPPPPTPADAGLPAAPTLIGDYEVAVLDVEDTDTLAGWLDEHAYAFRPEDLEVAGGYIDRGYTVVAVRVNAAARFAGALAPLAFSWEGLDTSIPVEISAEPGVRTGAPLTVYVAADTRYDVTDGVVRYAQPAFAVGGTSFLTRSDVWVELGTGLPDPEALPPPLPAAVQETYEVTRVVRIPSSECPRSRDERGCACRAGSRAPRGPAMLVLLGATGLALGARRRRRPRG